MEATEWPMLNSDRGSGMQDIRFGNPDTEMRHLPAREPLSRDE